MNTHALTPARPRLSLRLRPRLALDVGLAVALFWAANAVYRSSHSTVQLCDSTYSLVVAEKFLTDRTLDLRSCIPADPAARAKMPGYQPGHDLPYHLVRRPDPRDPAAPPRVHYGYPLGSVVLSLPFVAHYARGKGMSTLGPDGVPSYEAEGEVQVRIASRVSALTVVLFFCIARFFCSPAVAGLIAAGFAFGSPVYSTLARALWSHTWMVFWLSVAVVLLVGLRRVRDATWKTDLAFGLGIGTSLFWAAFCRQHAVLSAAAIGVHLVLHHRRVLAFTIVGGGLWGGALVLLSHGYFGSTLPPSVYAANVIDGHDVLNRFAWLMVSPARGLLVYCPYLVVVAALLLGCRKHLADAGLLLPAGLAIAAHTLLISSYAGWHGNWAYGPRYFCDVLPWFVLATAVGVGGLAALPVPVVSWRKLVPAAALMACFAWGVFVHHRGATAKPAWHWNDLARAVGDEAAVKDWRHPQFLAGLTFLVNPDGTVTERR